MKNLNKYSGDDIIDFEDEELLKLCYLYKQLYIDKHLIISIGFNCYKRTIAIHMFNLVLKKYKNEYINNEIVKAFLMSLIDILYNRNDLTENQKDKLNFIITREFIRIKI